MISLEVYELVDLIRSIAFAPWVGLQCVYVAFPVILTYLYLSNYVKIVCYMT